MATLDELILADEVKLPEYLIVKTKANEFRHITHGQEVFHVVDHKVYNMANDEAGQLKDNKVVLDVQSDFVDYIASENKQPYVGLSNPIRVKLADFEKADLDRQLLVFFKKFVEGRFDFGPTVYAVDVIDGSGATPSNVTVDPEAKSASVEGE